MWKAGCGLFEIVLLRDLERAGITLSRKSLTRLVAAGGTARQKSRSDSGVLRRVDLPVARYFLKQRLCLAEVKGIDALRKPAIGGS